jgi:BASS family bile acid:Na+ symporter
MSLQPYVLLTVQLSVLCIGFGFGLKSTVADLLFLWRHPGLLLRSVAAMLVIMPVVAVVLTEWLDVRRTSEIVLIAMAISPVPPLLPRREAKAGGHQQYALSLMATLALLSIVTIPLSVALLAAYYDLPLTMAPSRIARAALITVLVPLAAGAAVRAWTPTVAARLLRPVSLLGTLLLAIGSVLLLFDTWRGIWNAIGDGTVLMVLTFVTIGIVVGRLLGGPDSKQATVLGLSTACRHPAITLSIASANFPDERFGATVLLYLLVGLAFLAPYIQWSRTRIAISDDSSAVSGGTLDPDPGRRSPSSPSDRPGGNRHGAESA